MHPLSTDFVRTIQETFPEGAAWLGELPKTTAEAAERWSLALGAPVPNLSFNYVCYATRADGTPAVLKLCVPRDEIRQEIEALRFYNGRVAARLYESDHERGWLLLERVHPGTLLSQLADDDRATEILAQTLLRLWVTPPPGRRFRPLSEWGDGLATLRQRYGGGSGPFPESLVGRAESTFAQVATTPVLLHADFHHENVLRRGESEWVVIDPKGMVGERVYDVGALLYNPFPRIRSHPNLRALLERRVSILAEVLDAPRDAIIEWGIAQAILSSWWTLEGQPEGSELPIEVRVAEALAAL